MDKAYKEAMKKLGKDAAQQLVAGDPSLQPDDIVIGGSDGDAAGGAPVELSSRQRYWRQGCCLSRNF